MTELAERAFLALNRLAKWRVLFAGWQLGTRPDTDPEAAAVRDHREATLMLRAEVDALITILDRKGVATQDEFCKEIIHAAEHRDQELRQRFPGVEATDSGLTMDPAIVREWMRARSWKP